MDGWMESAEESAAESAAEMAPASAAESAEESAAESAEKKQEKVQPDKRGGVLLLRNGRRLQAAPHAVFVEVLVKDGAEEPLADGEVHAAVVHLGRTADVAVSYTHLTLPTILRV